MTFSFSKFWYNFKSEKNYNYLFVALFKKARSKEDFKSAIMRAMVKK